MRLAHSHALGLYTATPCSLQPLYKKRRCSLHCTSAAPSAEPLAGLPAAAGPVWVAVDRPGVGSARGNSNL